MTGGTLDDVSGLGDPMPDVSHLVTEDDEPVDIFSGIQMRLLAGSLNTSWQPGVPFFAMCSVAVYVTPEHPPVVPDVLVRTGVSRLHDPWKKENRSYFVWRYGGKPPDIVVEIVLGDKRSVLDRKMRAYGDMGVQWCAVFDPLCELQDQPLVCHELKDGDYLPRPNPSMTRGLGLTLWKGRHEGSVQTWLRWTDSDGQLLATGAELAQAIREQSESARAKAEFFGAELEHQRVLKLEAKLRELGVDPDNLVPSP